MNTPIKDFTDKYASSGTVRAHMPGHKGKSGCELDITEIMGADSLFEAQGIIAESEKNASRIFGSHKTVFSAGGSTLCIQTMLAMCTGRSKKVVAARNCHRAFLSACVLLGLDVTWIYPEYENTVVSGRITPDAVEKAIKEAGNPACVYITSPDYLGKSAPLDEIGAVCRRYGVRLAVDNAHGAYLRFIYDEKGVPLHPIYHGADICCDSAHKTLPVLTGGAYLHIIDPGLEKYDGFAKEKMALFGSSSPSYLILRSLDICNGFMEKDGDKYFALMKEHSIRLKKRLSPAWQIEEGECGKLVIFAPGAGFTGHELADRFRDNGIECEYADNVHVVFMLTGLEGEEFDRIAAAAEAIRQPRIFVPVPELSGAAPLERAMSIREAALSESENIPAQEAEGRICAVPVSCCPPGIALVVSGEVFSKNSINILKNYSIFRVNVVK